MNEKIVKCSYLAIDYKAAQRWLDEQAQDGWELTAMKEGKAHFVQSHRSNLRHCVDLAGGKFDQSYLDLCEESGWHLVGSYGRMRFFVSREGMSPDPIQTDEAIELQRFGQIFFRDIKILLIPVFFLVVILGMQGYAAWEEQWRIYEILFTNYMLSTLLQWVAILGVLVFFAYLLWYWHKMRQKLREGEHLPIPSRRGAVARATLIRCCSWLSVLVYIPIMLSLMNVYGSLLGFDRNWEQDGFRFRESGSLLGTYAQASDSYDYSGWVLVDSFDCRFSWVADVVVADLLRQERDDHVSMGHLHDYAQPMEAVDWGYDETYFSIAPLSQEWSEPIHSLIIREGNQVLRLCGDMDFTTETAKEKINQAME